MMKILPSIVLALSALSIGIGLGLGPDKAYYFHAMGIGRAAEEEAVRQTVKDFNDSLMDVYAAQGSRETLDQIPGTTEIKHRLFKDMGYMAFEGRVLVYDMANMEIDRVEIKGPFRAEADVYEEWNYVYQDSATRQPVSRLKGMGMSFRYMFFKKDGIWLVYDYVPLRQDGG